MYRSSRTLLLMFALVTAGVAETRAQTYYVTAYASTNVNSPTDPYSATQQMPLNASEYATDSYYPGGAYGSTVDTSSDGQLRSGVGGQIAYMDSSSSAQQDGWGGSTESYAEIVDTATVKSATLPFGTPVSVTLYGSTSGAANADAGEGDPAVEGFPQNITGSGGAWGNASATDTSVNGQSVSFAVGGPSGLGASASWSNANEGSTSDSEPLDGSGQAVLLTQVGAVVRFDAEFGTNAAANGDFKSSSSGSAQGEMSVTFGITQGAFLRFDSAVPAPPALSLFAGGMTCLYNRTRRGRNRSRP